MHFYVLQCADFGSKLQVPTIHDEKLMMSRWLIEKLPNIATPWTEGIRIKLEIKYNVDCLIIIYQFKRLQQNPIQAFHDSKATISCKPESLDFVY